MKNLREYAECEIEKHNKKRPEFFVKINHRSVNRFLLRHSQNGICLYCLKPISLPQLFFGETEADHIIPRSRCSDNSQDNKVICCQKCGKQKKNRTPFQWLANMQPERYEAMLQHLQPLVDEGKFSLEKFERIKK